jgi:hypothetical protein
MQKTKRERFEEIASNRVNKVILALQSLQKCSNTYNYEYNEDDVRKMLQAIRQQTEELKAAFDKGVSKRKIKSFKF